MKIPRICPRGHRWESENGKPASCPVCAVDDLPVDQRDVLIAHYAHGAPLAEIAQQVGKAEKAVAMLLYRAKCRLRELLADDKGASP